MHKLIVPVHICYCNFRTQPPARTSPTQHFCIVLCNFYIVEVLQFLNFNNHCTSYGILYNEYNRTVLYLSLSFVVLA
jgi:hypothetical protein